MCTLLFKLFPVDTKTSQRSRKNILILVSGTSYIGLKWKLRRHFFKTSSRRLPGDVLKTSSGRRPQDVFQETSSRPLPGYLRKTSLRRLKTSKFFLLRTKDHMETIYGLFMYVRFKLLTYYQCSTRKTNWINLNKLNPLKHGNNTEIMKTLFSMNCQI